MLIAEKEAKERKLARRNATKHGHAARNKTSLRGAAFRVSRSAAKLVVRLFQEPLPGWRRAIVDRGTVCPVDVQDAKRMVGSETIATGILNRRGESLRIGLSMNSYETFHKR